MKKSLIVLAAATFFMPYSVHAAEASVQQDVLPAPGNDLRQLVSMPAEALALMRQDMLDHQLSLTEIIGHLADDNFVAAGEVAETRMGKSSMGKHRATGMGPGRYMPPEMRQLGKGMHDAASEFARIAQQGEKAQAYRALQKITDTCVACHQTYRTR